MNGLSHEQVMALLKAIPNFNATPVCMFLHVVVLSSAGCDLGAVCDPDQYTLST